MSFKGLLFLVPVAVGGWYVTRGDEAASGGADTARAEAKAAAPRKSLEECRELEQRMLEANALDPAAQNGFATIRRVHAMHRELQRQGCDPGAANRADGRFREISNRMGDPPPHPRAGPAEGVSFEPGRPMVDVGGSGNGR